MRKRTLLLGVVAAMATVALSLGAAPSANALRVIKCGADGTCKEYCRQQLPNGNTVDYPEGTEITVNQPDGTSRKFTCKNGQWVDTTKLSEPLPGLRGWGIGAVLGVGELKGTMEVPNACSPDVVFCPPTISISVGPPGQIAGNSP
jgi:hypothetical protein